MVESGHQDGVKIADFPLLCNCVNLYLLPLQSECDISGLPNFLIIFC